MNAASISDAATIRRTPARQPPALCHWRTSGIAHLFLRVLLAAFCFARPVFAQDTSATEYQIKAAFLLNFARFVEWPPNAFSNDTAPIVLCIFQYDPFGPALDAILRGKIIKNRKVLARRVDDLPDLKNCQLIFVSAREGKRLPDISNTLVGVSALLVGESDDFALRGGAIQFFIENNHLHFAVNVDAMDRARLKVSSQLLALARIVHDAGGTRGV